MRIRLLLLLGPCAGLVLLATAGCAASTLADSGAPGSWSIQPTPNPTAPDPIPTEHIRYPGGSLLGVSCPSARVCVAVGNNVLSTRALAEGWDGSHWSIQHTPNPGWGGLLLAVSCPSVRDCTAVGGSYPTVDMGLGSAHRNAGNTLAERWNGQRWAIQPTPNRPAGDTLKSVSCLSASFCMAVGEFAPPYPSDALATLAERWDGVRWSIERTPSPSGHPYPGSETRPGSWLEGVSCASVRACIAVGQRTDGKLITERWDGHHWSLQPTSGPTRYGQQLSGVDCQPTFCIAVGWEVTGRTAQILIERWDGSRWAIQHAPSPVGGAGFWGVSCPSTRACTAVGFKAGGKHTLTTLAERWNGTRWSTQSTPTRSRYDALLGVSCPSPRACTAVGQTYKRAWTLAERWTG